MDTGDSHRAAQRDSVYLSALLRCSAGELLALVRNVSPGGALIEIDKKVSVGEQVSIELKDIGWISGVVAWTEPGRAGLKFDEPVDLATSAAKPVPHAPDVAVCLPPESLAVTKNAQLATLFYVVKFVKAQEVLDEFRFRHLVEAKAYAKDKFPFKKIRKGATAYEVSDLDGITYFRGGD
jgi:hypothetical protein